MNTREAILFQNTMRSIEAVNDDKAVKLGSNQNSSNKSMDLLDID